MAHKFLQNSTLIRESVAELFSNSDEKYAVVAFVGVDGAEYLPNPKNTTVICWPKAGGTNPEGIRNLLDKGFNVKFCDNLHSKIYWCKNKGVIISSSNLSDNALGDSGLIEYGVFIDDLTYDFKNDVLNKIEMQLREVTDEELDQLDIDTNKFNRKTKISTNINSNNFTYAEWFKRNYKQKWKIVWYSAISEADDITKNEVFEKFGVTKWKNDNDVEPNVFQEGDLVFQFKTDEDEALIPRANGEWFYVDMITSTKKIIQVDNINNVSIPFKIDSSFRKAFKKALSELEWENISDEQQIPKKQFLELIYDYYQDYQGKS